MRIIGGSVGGRTLKSKKGRDTRPTADRVREAIFNILLASAAPPERVLDLYAGTGAMGLEARSRGARAAEFVESDRAACALIRDNARALGLDGVEVHHQRVLDFLGRAAVEPCGWIFVDPPYAAGELERALDGLAPLLAPGGVVVAEYDWRHAPGERHGGLARSDVRRYGQTGVSFFRRAPHE